MTTRHIEMSFRMRCAIREDADSKTFVAFCPALDVYSSGRTRPEAREALTGALKLYIRVCYDRQILGTVLHKRGFSADEQIAVPGMPKLAPASDGEYIAVTETVLEGRHFDDEFDIDVPMLLWQMPLGRVPERQACLQ